MPAGMATTAPVTSKLVIMDRVKFTRKAIMVDAISTRVVIKEDTYTTTAVAEGVGMEVVKSVRRVIIQGVQSS